MRIIALSTLKVFREENILYTDAIQPVLACWYRHALKANWTTPEKVKADLKVPISSKSAESYSILLVINTD